MKRTKNIDLSQMRKATSPFSLKPLALGVMAVLAGCSPQQEEAKLVSSVADCTANTPMSEQECEAAYQKALIEAERTGPKYSQQSQCEAEFGYNQCNRTSSGFFTPFMTGFLVSSAINQFSNRHYNPVFAYNNSNSRYRNQLMTADGTVIGRNGGRSYNVSKETLNKPMPAATRTVSRGGFGAVASAKSSWGGGKSRSGGWGG